MLRNAGEHVLFICNRLSSGSCRQPCFLKVQEQMYKPKSLTSGYRPRPRTIRFSTKAVNRCSDVSWLLIGQKPSPSSGDSWLVEHETSGQRMQGTVRLLLLLQAANDDLDSVMALLEKAKVEGVEPSLKVMSDVARTFIRLKNVDAALQIHQLVSTHHSSQSLPLATIITLCTLMLESGRTIEALITLKEYFQLTSQESEELQETRSEYRALLTASANTCDYQLTRDIFEELLRAGMIEPENFTVVPLLHCKLSSGDVVGVVEVAEQIYRDYRLLPKRMEVIIAVLKHYTKNNMEISLPNNMEWCGESDDPLHRVMSLVCDCHSHHQAAHDLFFTALEAHLPTLASQVLQNLGDKIERAQVEKMCGLYGKAGMEDTLLHLLNVSRLCPSAALPRHKFYLPLLEVYVERGDEEAGRKALSLYQTMLAEDLTPPSRFLTSLTALLSARDIDLPAGFTPCPSL